MVESWTVSDWAVLVVDVVAITVVVIFLKRKIQHKLHEVELRQAHQRLHQRSQNRSVDEVKPTETIREE